MISYGTGFIVYIVLVWAEMRDIYSPTSCDGKWLCRDHVSVYLTLKHSGKSSGVSMYYACSVTSYRVSSTDSFALRCKLHQIIL